MHCNNCKKEQETITIAGKTYCASCSTILEDKGADKEADLKHKIPKIETTDNKIRTETVSTPQREDNPEIRELSRNTQIADVSKDDLSGSAILLDIIADEAKELADKKTLENNKKLEEASEEILNLLGKEQPSPQKTVHKETKVGNGNMNDIVPTNIKRRTDHLGKKHTHTVKEAKQEIKDEVENLGRIVTSESGYTKEYDIMILSIALTTVVLVVLAIFMTFK